MYQATPAPKAIHHHPIIPSEKKNYFLKCVVKLLGNTKKYGFPFKYWKNAIGI